eukprot:TRINITY_DN44115_c0_g1_i1.p1 TRINITY_DN44115_c0_g1~~TRINITY_DN44115_c0_g1_i1.p1  ORF type:complete len:465 (-),score=77.99 TRINITY_DN44115_c0_g1_i1:367-1761(-)
MLGSSELHGLAGVEPPWPQAEQVKLGQPDKAFKRVMRRMLLEPLPHTPSSQGLHKPLAAAAFDVDGFLTAASVAANEEQEAPQIFCGYPPSSYAGSRRSTPPTGPSAEQLLLGSRPGTAERPRTAGDRPRTAEGPKPMQAIGFSAPLHLRGADDVPGEPSSPWVAVAEAFVLPLDMQQDVRRLTSACSSHTACVLADEQQVTVWALSAAPPSSSAGGGDCGEARVMEPLASRRASPGELAVQPVTLVVERQSRGDDGDTPLRHGEGIRLRVADDPGLYLAHNASNSPCSRHVSAYGGRGGGIGGRGRGTSGYAGRGGRGRGGGYAGHSSLSGGSVGGLCWARVAEDGESSTSACGRGRPHGTRFAAHGGELGQPVRLGRPIALIRVASPAVEESESEDSDLDPETACLLRGAGSLAPTPRASVHSLGDGFVRTQQARRDGQPLLSRFADASPAFPATFLPAAGP